MNSTDLLDLLRRQSTPVTAAEVAKLTGAKAKPTTQALDELASSGQAFAFTQGKGTAYATKRPLDLCSDALTSVLALQTTAVSPPKLKAALPKGLRAWFDEALGRLIVQGKAGWLPVGKSKLVLGRTVRPSDLVTKPQLAAIQKVLMEANRRRREPRTITQFLSWLDGDESAAPKLDHEEPAQVSRDQLLTWYAADRALASSAMIAIPSTWRRYVAWAKSEGTQADASLFRAALSEMYEAGEAILEPCERPQDLPEEERLLQVALTFGPPGFYWRPLER